MEPDAVLNDLVRSTHFPRHLTSLLHLISLYPSHLHLGWSKLQLRELNLCPTA